jgi:beta-galactosidase
VYAFPIDDKFAAKNQVTSWDLCFVYPNDCIPDVELIAQDLNPHVFGEFVWTGFDYLGEPDPWRKVARSSYFGIFDLCGLPKDRYWLYKSKWRPDVPTAHILPHWNWKEGMSIPVHVYTSGDEAELFVNGVSQGRRQKKWYGYSNAPRLRWEGVKFVPGEITVKTWKDGRPWAEDRRVTAGDFDHFEFEDRKWGEKFLFRTVCAVDKKGVLVPDAAEDVDLPVPDGYKVLGTCNGDPTDLNSLRSKKVKTFSGKALIVYEFCK